MARKLDDGGIIEEEQDLLSREAIQRKISEYMNVSRDHLKRDLKRLLLEKPQIFLEELQSISEQNIQVKGVILQAIFNMVSNYLFRRIWELSRKHDIDFIEFVSSASNSMLVPGRENKLDVTLPEDLRVYYDILVSLSKYEIKTKLFYSYRREKQFLIPQLYTEKLDDRKHFVLNPQNGRWAIVEDVSALTAERYIRRSGLSDIIVGDLLVLPDNILTPEEKSFMEGLSKARVIYTNASKPYVESPRLDISPTLLSIVLTTACNFRCKYCYEGDYPVIRPNDKAIYNRINEVFSKFPTIRSVSFFGGEPLLEFTLIRKLVLNPFVYNSRKSIQTNGSMITPEVARYFRLHRISVGISLDGPGQYNRLRILRNGNYSYDVVLRGIENLKSQRVKFSVLSTYSSVSRGLENEYIDWITSVGPQSFGVNIGVHREYLPSWKDTLHFFEKTFEDYVNSDIWDKQRYSTFLYYMDALLTVPEKRALMMFRNPCGAGRSHLVINSDGSLSPCPELFAFKSDSLNFYDAFKPVYNRVVEHMCPECPFRYICTGACPGKSLIYHGKIDKPIDELCNFYKRFFVWLAERIYDEPKYLEVYKKWKRNLKENQIIQVK